VPTPSEQATIDYDLILQVEAVDFAAAAQGEEKTENFNEQAGCYVFTAEDGKGNIKTAALKEAENKDELMEKAQCEQEGTNLRCYTQETQ